jgi:hypothetical protein
MAELLQVGARRALAAAARAAAVCAAAPRAAPPAIPRWQLGEPGGAAGGDGPPPLQRARAAVSQLHEGPPPLQLHAGHRPTPPRPCLQAAG